MEQPLDRYQQPFFYNPAGTGVNNPANFQFLDPSCNYNKYMAGGCAFAIPFRSCSQKPKTSLH
jgi:hypothetical protein